MQAMIFAAGLGTRLKPLTDHLPKALVSLQGKPMLEHVILKLKSAGFTQVVVNVHHFGQQIIDFLEERQYFGIHIAVSDERGLLLDTGGGIKKAAAFFSPDEPVLIHNTDILSDVDVAALYEAHRQSGAFATLLVSERETSRYLLFDAGNRLRGWENRKTGEVKSPLADFRWEDYRPYAFGGIHVISPAVFERMEGWEGKFSIIDFYLSLAGREEIRAYPVPSGSFWMDLGKPEALQKAEEYLRGS